MVIYNYFTGLWQPSLLPAVSLFLMISEWYLPFEPADYGTCVARCRLIVRILLKHPLFYAFCTFWCFGVDASNITALRSPCPHHIMDPRRPADPRLSRDPRRAQDPRLVRASADPRANLGPPALVPPPQAPPIQVSVPTHSPKPQIARPPPVLSSAETKTPPKQRPLFCVVCASNNVIIPCICATNI